MQERINELSIESKILRFLRKIKILRLYLDKFLHISIYTKKDEGKI